MTNQNSKKIKISQENKKNIRFIFKLLLFLFGLGVIIFGKSTEIKMFGLVYLVLSLQ